MPLFGFDKFARPLSPASTDWAARREWKTEDPAFHRVSRLNGEGEKAGGDACDRNVSLGRDDSVARDIGTMTPVKQRVKTVNRVLPTIGKIAVNAPVIRSEIRAVILQNAKGAFHQSRS